MIRRLFGVDARALAALRVGIGALVIADLVGRARDLGSLYGDGGAWPRSAAESFTLYSLSGSPAFAATLFALTALAAAMLALGYHTWLATAATWFLLVSLHQRHALVLNGGDQVLALLLLWGLFLPLGARASVDSRRGPRAPGTVVSVGSAALLIQVASIYVFTALLKSPRSWLVEATAVREALSIDAYLRPWAGALLGHPGLLALASRATYLLELVGPLAAFVPLATGRIRTVVVALFVAFHLGLAAAMDLVLFSWVCIVAWLAFLPEGAWDRLCASAFLRPLLDAWRALVGFVARLEARAARRVPALASPGVDAAGSRLGAAVAGLLALWVLAWNLSTVGVVPAVPGSLGSIGRALYLHQDWNMFAPAPTPIDGWYVAPARLADGTEVDLYSGHEPVDWNRPARLRETYRSGRWCRFLLERLWRPRNRDRVVHFARWLRHRWEAGHGPDRRVEWMSIVLMLELTRSEGGPPRDGRELLYEWSAAGGDRVIHYADGTGPRR